MKSKAGNTVWTASATPPPEEETVAYTSGDVPMSLPVGEYMVEMTQGATLACSRWLCGLCGGFRGCCAPGSANPPAPCGV